MENKIHVLWKPETGEPRELTMKKEENSSNEPIHDFRTRENTWRQGPTKREKQSENMSNRIPICQASVNPFMQGSYMDHLENETSFLRPRSSNQE
jgi:hypothetical protein